ncbi:MAG TPA: type IV pili methyl-accepting chemotaxis transducer N-terminal domain-containing protein [Thiobacillaceae bacterium]|nr:type IV pili methyl-accepting chemotaxis transducer N-terminal domain-containing protein [Thiobacillaceae bacterium]
MDRTHLCAWLVAGLPLVAAPTFVHAVVPPAAAAAKLDAASAVALAESQRMLSQRMVKAYLLAGQGIGADDARAVLQSSIRQFEAQLASLKSLQPTPAVRTAVAALERAWGPCKAVFATAPSKRGAIALYDANEALQEAAHSSALAYEDAAGLASARAVSVAGRQHMLLQRMAKFYFYRTWGLYDAPADMELHLSRAHFTAVLAQIERSPQASAQVKAGAAQVRKEWEPYQQALFASRDPDRMRHDAMRVAALSERMIGVTEKLAAQLAADGRSAAGVARDAPQSVDMSVFSGRMFK